MACRGSQASPAQPASAILLPVDKSAQVGTDEQKTHPDLAVEEVDIIVACSGFQDNGLMVCENLEIMAVQNANAPPEKSAPPENPEDTSTTADDFPSDDSLETPFVRQTGLDSAPESTNQKASGSGYVPSAEASTTADDFPSDYSLDPPFVRQTTLDSAPESTIQKASGSGYAPSSEASTTADDFLMDDLLEPPYVRQALDSAPENMKHILFGRGCLHYSEAKLDDGPRLKGPNQAARGVKFKMEVMEEQALLDDEIVEPARKPHGWMCCSGPNSRK